MLIAFVYEFYYEDVYYEFFDSLMIISPFLMSNVISDYLSLFIIRRWLAKGGHRPLFSILR
jgi:hypothetical protein